MVVEPQIARSLDNFPSDQEIQQLACQILRRVYIRARENTIMGSRVVTLGKQLDEVQGFDHTFWIFMNLCIYI